MVMRPQSLYHITARTDEEAISWIRDSRVLLASPIMTGLPSSSGRSRYSTAAKNVSMSTWRMMRSDIISTVVQ